MEILGADKLESIINAMNFRDPEAEKIEDALLSRFLKYVHVLGQLETNLIKENGNVDPDLFYSRYYWFNQFKERYSILYDHDEGLEQQSFKMLSDYNERFPEKIDWSIIEQIEKNL